MKTTSAGNIANKIPAIPALTGIRFFAAVYVFLYHYGATSLAGRGAPGVLVTFLQNGFFGVSAFYVLSGFILSHAHPAVINSPVQYGNFMIARLARIYPVYLFALLITIPVVLHPLTPRAVTTVLLLVQSWSSALSTSGRAWIIQAWSLSVEFAFYLSFPFLVRGIRRLGNAALIAICLLNAAWLVAGGISNITGENHLGNPDIPDWLLYVPLPLTRMAEFTFGILLHTLIKRMPKISYHSTWLALLTLAIVVDLAISKDAHIVSCATVLVGVLIALIYVSENSFTRLVGSPALYVLGSASYALYLLQYPCRSYAMLLLGPSWGRLTALPLDVVLSIVVWRLLEEPARRFIVRRRFREHPPIVALPAVKAPAS